MAPAEMTSEEGGGELSVRLLDDGGSRPAVVLPAVVGREAADLILDDPSVSRRHARFSSNGGEFVVQDLGSANGTHVERGGTVITVRDTLVLRAGDVIRIGSHRLAVEGAARRDAAAGEPWQRAVNPPTVIAGFANFFAGFLMWALVPVFAKSMAAEVGYSADGLAPLLIASVPVLSGAVARIVFGLWTDTRAPALSGTISLAIGAVPLTALWLAGDQAVVVWASAALLGVGLAAPPISIPMGAQRTAPQKRGVALGVISAGSIGVVVAALGGSQLAAAIGWRDTCAIALVPLALCTAIFAWGSRGAWVAPSAAARSGLVANPGLWYVAALYGVTFGGFAALYSFLPTPLQEGDFDLSGQEAALVVALGALFGSMVRPIGGSLADRFGTLSVLPFIYALTTVFLLFAGNLGAAGGIVLLIATMTVLEAGTGSVFKLATQRFGSALGTGAGLVGSVGGFIGFGIFVLLLVVFETSDDAAVTFAVLVPIPAAAAAAMVVQRRLAPSTSRRYAPPPGPRFELLDAYGAPVAGWPAGESLTIGRTAENGVQLANDDLVSRRHAGVSLNEGASEITDLGSTNGTHLWRGDRWLRVSSEHLDDGDIVVIGATVLRFAAGEG